MLFILVLALLSCISCGAHEFPDRRSSQTPEKPGALTSAAAGPSELGNVWQTRELNPQGKGCDGVWTRRPGTNVFDARWQCVVESKHNGNRMRELRLRARSSS